MSSTQYGVYRDSVFTLAKTLVIKSSTTADAINKGLGDLGYAVNLSDPSVWKYYLNLNGQYHATDTPMTVVSIDTLETIAFTKDNLAIHRGTATEYCYGTRYYTELVRRYPTQETLILGILNPIELSTAIDAADGTILYHDASLVESNEVNLIASLEDWIKVYLSRWHNSSYEVVDDLYAPAMLGMMYAQIPSIILNLRMAACKTNEVHSYHIREYLASNGALEEFIDTLNKKQALFLYRNIRWLHRNTGKEETFQLLVSRLLTDRGLPILEYDLRHNLSRQPENLLPDVEMVQYPVNFGDRSRWDKTRTVREIMLKQTSLAAGNARDLDAEEDSLIADFRNSKFDQLPTKVFESEVLDLSDSAEFTLSDTIFNHWLYLSHTGRYGGYIRVPHPATGEELIFTAKEAFIVYLYTFNKTRGIDLPYIPIVTASRVRKLNLPLLSDLRSLIPAGYVEDSYLEQILADQPTIDYYVAVRSFHDVCTSIHKAMRAHREMYSLQEHMRTRGYVEAACLHLYQDVECDLAGETNYATWFTNKGLNIHTLGVLDCELLANEIFRLTTGASLFTALSLKDIQASMLKLMTKLSSYSIHFLQDINAEAFRYADWPVIRVGDHSVITRDKLQLEVGGIRLNDIHAKGFGNLELDLKIIGNDITYRANAKHLEHFPFALEYALSGVVKSDVRGEMPNIEFEFDGVPIRSLISIISEDELEGLFDPLRNINSVLSKDLLDGLLPPPASLEILLHDDLMMGLRWPLASLRFLITHDVFSSVLPQFSDLSLMLADTYNGLYIRPLNPQTVLEGFNYPDRIVVLSGINEPDLLVVLDSDLEPDKLILVDGFEPPEASSNLLDGSNPLDGSLILD